MLLPAGLLLSLLAGKPFQLTLRDHPAILTGAAILLTLCLSGLVRSFDRRLRLRHYIRLLGFLSGRLSAGIAFEHALIEAADVFREEVGTARTVTGALLRLQRQLNAHVTLARALEQFGHDVDLSLCREDMAMLPPLIEAGGRVDLYIRQRHRALLTIWSIRREVVAEFSGKITETLILNAAPLIAALIFLGQVDETDHAVGSTLCALLFAGTVIAFGLTLMCLSSRKPTAAPKAPRPPRDHRAPGPRTTHLVSVLYRRLLPGQLADQLDRAFTLLGRNREDTVRRFIRLKPILFLGGLAGALFLTFFLPTRWPLLLVACPALVWFLHDVALIARARDVRAHYRLTAPHLFNTMVILLASGLTVDRVIRLMGDRPCPQAHTPARDLRYAAGLLEAGYNGTEAVLYLAERAPLPDIEAGFRLIARYSRQGGTELLELLKLQSQSLWQTYRHAEHAELERRLMRLVLPMALDLFVVIGVTVAPYLSAFSVVFGPTV